MADAWRFHAFFTTTDPDALDTVAGERLTAATRSSKTVHADRKNSPLAHLPSGKFAANAAWLVLATMAFNLSRAAATLTGAALANATTGYSIAIGRSSRSARRAARRYGVFVGPASDHRPHREQAPEVGPG